MTIQEKARKFLESKQDANYYEVLCTLAMFFGLTPKVCEDKIREIAE
jgi:hypothetical protein